MEVPGYISQIRRLDISVRGRHRLYLTGEGQHISHIGGPRTYITEADTVHISKKRTEGIPYKEELRTYYT